MVGLTKPFLSALAATSLLSGVSGSASSVAASDNTSVGLRRALPNSPSHGYAPATVDCPLQRPVLRNAARLSPDETAWLSVRRNNTIKPMTDFLKRVNISGFDVDGFMSSASNNARSLPNIGIAVSGGGYRAFMNGAGFIAAADSRVAGSVSSGGIGGLLQSATYLSGLSGGGWLVGSIYANNFSTVPQLQAGNPDTGLWAFDRSIFQGPSIESLGTLTTFNYWEGLYSEVQSKAKAGYNTSITDYWGRALSYQLVNHPKGGPAYTFSSISRTPGFNDANQPLPILVADEREPGTKVISGNSTIYEFNPWEMGSWDPTVFGFAPLQYLGSDFSNGTVSNTGRCVSGFDQFGYIMGTSSTLFNAILLRNVSTLDVPKIVKDVLEALAEEIQGDDADIAKYTPNPFFHFNNATNPSALTKQLSLVDGGEDHQNIPLHPLIQPERGVDVIFAVDSSADTNSWPNATALRATYARSLERIGNGTKFPTIPSAETFINLGLNRRPTVFGCNVALTGTGTGSSNFTTNQDVSYPLVVYMPNTPYTAMSNVSTFEMNYDDETRNSIIQNGYNVATMGNGTLDNSWPTCVGCFILQRSLVRTSTQIPKDCQGCYNRFCYNGTVDDRPVPKSFEPTPFLLLTGTSNETPSGTSPGNAASPTKKNAAVRPGVGAGSPACTALLVVASALMSLL